MKPIPETTLVEPVAAEVAAIAILTAIIAMAIEHTALVILGSLLSMVVGPYAYWQQARLTDIRALQATQRVIQEQVDKLKQENEVLAQEVKKRTDSLQRMYDIQQALDFLLGLQRQSIDIFAKQVEVNEGILKQMQSNLKACVMQNFTFHGITK